MKDTREEVSVLIEAAHEQLAEALGNPNEYGIVTSQRSIACSLLAIAKLLNEVTNGGDKLHISDGTFRGI